MITSDINLAIESLKKVQQTSYQTMVNKHIQKVSTSMPKVLTKMPPKILSNMLSSFCPSCCPIACLICRSKCCPHGCPKVCSTKMIEDLLRHVQTFVQQADGLGSRMLPFSTFSEKFWGAFFDPE